MIASLEERRAREATLLSVPRLFVALSFDIRVRPAEVGAGILLSEEFPHLPLLPNFSDSSLKLCMSAHVSRTSRSCAIDPSSKSAR
jgi:hypothetical protein